MEELIDEFLEELIDKKEISKNERIDMKETLMEAMPNNMDKNGAVRVISTLKSKMETPSANIFTDKGVNIDVVRIIANETVKQVTEAIEKEETVKELAEAEQNAKINASIDEIIAEAERKEERNQHRDEKDIKAYNESYDKMKSLWGNKYSAEDIAYFAQIDAESKKLNEKAQQISEKEGLSAEEAFRKAIDIAADGDSEMAKALYVSNDANATEDVMKYIIAEMFENQIGRAHV